MAKVDKPFKNILCNWEVKDVHGTGNLCVRGQAVFDQDGVCPAGEFIITSKVVRISPVGNWLIAETLNSRYCLEK